ncbi:MAG TPA: hypothetical protein VH280_08225 [Verrucomicrobiae bacterium]|jgi:hypothetical protein|nr:hypothetical protein [Verrucomicrobiae bacterium]
MNMREDAPGVNKKYECAHISVKRDSFLPEMDTVPGDVACGGEGGMRWALSTSLISRCFKQLKIATAFLGPDTVLMTRKVARATCIKISRTLY